MAAPRKPIDPAHVVKELAKVQHTDTYIASVLGVHPSTIGRTYAKEVALGKAEGIAELQELLMKRVRDGSEKLLCYAMDRYMGPVTQKYTIDTSKLPVEEKKEVLRSLVSELDPHEGEK